MEDLREELVSIYPNLKRFALWYVRDMDRAEDLVLEACVRVLQREHKFDEQVNLVNYSITIIKNLAKDQGKIPRPLPEEDIPDLIDRTLPGDIYEFRESWFRLSEECQTILELFGMGHSYKEIAQELKTKMGTIMSRMSRCRENLRVELSMAT